MNTNENQIFWSQTAIQSGDTVSGTTSETIFSSKPQTFSANSLSVGDVVRFNCSGVFSTQTLNVATFTIRAKLGSTVVVATSALSVGILALVNSAWKFTGEFHVRAIGASGSIEGDAVAMLSTGAASAIGPLLSDAQGVTIDTTTDIQFQISAQLSISAGVNAITMRRFMVDKLRS